MTFSWRGKPRAVGVCLWHLPKLQLLAQRLLAGFCRLVLVPILCCATLTPASASINFYRLFKRETFEQTSDAAPTTPIGFDGGMDVLFSKSVDATFGLVDVGATQYPLQSTGVGVLSFSESFPTQTALDTSLPNNSLYEYRVFSGAPPQPQSAFLTTPSSNLFPTVVPHLPSGVYNQLQTLNSTSPFLFSWDGYTLAPGINAAFTYFRISRHSDGFQVFSTDGTNELTSVLLPADALDPSTSYDLNLYFSSRSTIPNAGFGAATSEVIFDLSTSLTFTTADLVSELIGDYNDDQTVNAADYSVWRDHLGETFDLPHEAATPHQVTLEDYSVWRDHFGESRVGSGGAAQSPAAPELATNALSIAALVVGFAGTPRITRRARPPAAGVVTAHPAASVRGGLSPAAAVST